jgi:arsenate reductase
MAFRSPKSIEDAARSGEPNLIVTMGCGDTCPMFPGVKTIEWDIPDPAGKTIEFMREVRDDIEKRVKELI